MLAARMANPSDPTDALKAAEASLSNHQKHVSALMDAIYATSIEHSIEPMQSYFALLTCASTLIAQMERCAPGGYNAQRMARMRSMSHEAIDKLFENAKYALEHAPKAGKQNKP